MADSTMGKPENKPVTRKVKPVKSRYLDCSRRADPKGSPGPSTSSGSGSTSAQSSNRSEKKTSTPNKEMSLFVPDLSIVSCGRPNVSKEEAKGDIGDELFQEYNMELLARAMQLICKEQRSKFSATADNQLRALQKCVSEGVCTLSDLHKQIDATVEIGEIDEEVTFYESFIQNVVGNPAVKDSKNFMDITEELEGVQSQLPCKNVLLPKSQQDFDKITGEAMKLSRRLDGIQELHGEEMTNTAEIKREVSAIDTLSSCLIESTESARELMPTVTSNVLDAISMNMIKAGLSNINVKF